MKYSKEWDKKTGMLPIDQMVQDMQDMQDMKTRCP